jgi:hypothetical protein
MGEQMARVAVNTALLAAVAVLALSGGLELFANGPALAWLYPLHRGAALALLPLLLWKLPIVAASLRRRRLALSVWPGLLLQVVVVGLALTGAVWTAGLARWWALAGNSVLALHLYLFFGLGPPLALHVRLRWRRPSARSFRQRRAVLRLAAAGGLGVAGVAAFALAAPWLRRFPAPRRFTGSFAAGSGAGNSFPVTAFLVDDPAPLPATTWRLHLSGRVARPLTLRYQDLLPTADAVAATVDCTGGWSAERVWSGRRLGRLLDRAQPRAGATVVLFRSATGYATVLPLAEARDALLATHVGGEPLAHGHGFPLRLVAPARRGFQWVKWLEQVEVL